MATAARRERASRSLAPASEAPRHPPVSFAARARCHRQRVGSTWRLAGAEWGLLGFSMQLRQMSYGVGTPRFQSCVSVGCTAVRWSLFAMFHLAWRSAHASLRAAGLNTRVRRKSPLGPSMEARRLVGLAPGSRAGISFRSGEFRASSPPSGSKLCHTPAVRKAGGRPFWPMSRMRRRRSLSSLRSACEAVCTHTGGDAGS